MAFERVSGAFGRLLAALAFAGCLLLLAMLAIIVTDVALRNLVLPGLPRGLAWSNEISELLLYAMTLFAAPWLLREGRHIRVDILLRVLPRGIAYACEWIADALGFACCCWLVLYGASAAKKSFLADALSIKTLVMPEWWILAPLPICFFLLAIEFLFRMRRLKLAEVGPRDDAVSAA